MSLVLRRGCAHKSLKDETCSIIPFPTATTYITWLLYLLLSPLTCALSSPSSAATTDAFPPPTSALITASGRPVCRYALGGAARSSQPQSLPGAYYQHLTESNDHQLGAPFYFYYNPHRYPAFLAGIREIIDGNSSDGGESPRKDIFVASGGTGRSTAAMEQRLQDALKYCGGDYLDMFVLEYVCPNELLQTEEDGQGVVPGTDLMRALQQARSWVDKGQVRYVAASTHSHRVGAALASQIGLVDALMLRYSMSHKDAAESLSFPACCVNNIPAIAFTTTRWNALQEGHPDWTGNPLPTTGDCLSFALAASPPVEVVLHSARDEQELREAMSGCREILQQEVDNWRDYGNLDWNEQDSFDEHPEERTQ